MKIPDIGLFIYDSDLMGLLTSRDMGYGEVVPFEVKLDEETAIPLLVNCSGADGQLLWCVAKNASMLDLYRCLSVAFKPNKVLSITRLDERV